MSQNLLVVGSVAFDGIETRAGKRDEILGGAATYISLAASRYCQVQLVAVVGENDFPDEHTRMLADRGVDLAGLERVPGRTFRWVGVYANDFSSRKTLDTQLGVFAAFRPKIPAAYARSKFVMLGNINPELQLAVLDAVQGGHFVAMDTMNLWIETARDALGAVMRRTDLLTINDEEAFLLTGERQIARAATEIRKMGPKAVIIKRGEHGAFLFHKDGVFFAPAFLLEEVVDPTGAGDSFAGGLLGHLASEDRTDFSALKRGMLYGAAIASATCEAFGVERTARVTREEIDERVASLRALTALDRP
jgi:sugar/nucleoside kinase (ribokinase family)